MTIDGEVCPTCDGCGRIVYAKVNEQPVEKRTPSQWFTQGEIDAVLADADTLAEYRQKFSFFEELPTERGCLLMAQIIRQLLIAPERESGEVDAWRNRCHAADREYQELMEKYLSPKVVDVSAGCEVFREATNPQDLEIGIGYESGIKAVADAWGLKYADS